MIVWSKIHDPIFFWTVLMIRLDLIERKKSAIDEDINGRLYIYSSGYLSGTINFLLAVTK